MLDVYGGEYAFDRYTVRLYNRRGENRGVSIRYGKNLTDLEQEENCANVYTGVYPYYIDGEGALTQLPEKIVNAPGTYPFTRILPLDQSQYFDEPPTSSQMRTAAQSYIRDNRIGTPKVSLSVSFVQLEQTEEYKHLAGLEQVSLCDEVNVEFPAMGVSTTAKCVKTIYDVLLGRYISVELGDARTNIADTIANQQAEIKSKPGTSVMQSAIDKATSQITGNLGGYVVLHSSSGGTQPDEILIMDQPDIKTAVKVWRWNKAGLGYSSNGYNGPYGLAMTADGQIVADFITTGTLSANRIKSGIIESDNGESYFNLETGDVNFTGELSTKTVSVNGSSVKLALNSSGLNVTSGDTVTNVIWVDNDGTGAVVRSHAFHVIDEEGKILGYFGINGLKDMNGNYLDPGSHLDTNRVDADKLEARNEFKLGSYKAVWRYITTADGETIRVLAKAGD